MSEYYLLILLVLVVILAIPVLIIGAIVRHSRRGNRRQKQAGETEMWYFHAFLLLTKLFFDVTCLSINRSFGSPLAVETVILITSLVAVAVGYFYRSSITAGLGVLGVVGWWFTKAMFWTQLATGGDVKGAVILGGAVLIIAIFYAVGRWHTTVLKWPVLGMTYNLMGLLLMTFLLFAFSSKSGLSSLNYATAGQSIFVSWQLTISLLVMLIMFILAVSQLWLNKLAQEMELIALVLLTLLFLMFIFPPPQAWFSGRGWSQDLNGFGLFWAIIMNLLVFAETIGVVALGYMRREEYLVNLGLAFVFMLVIYKYFDWFFTFLDKSIFFITIGLIFFGVGWLLERGRRSIIAEVKESKKEVENG